MDFARLGRVRRRCLTPSPKPQARVPKSKTPDPRPQTPDPKPSTLNSAAGHGGRVVRGVGGAGKGDGAALVAGMSLAAPAEVSALERESSLLTTYWSESLDEILTVDRPCAMKV